MITKVLARYKCLKKCVICFDHFQESKYFFSSRTNETFTIRERFTCESTNVIYFLFCEKCQHSQYAGETKTLKIRFYLHRSNNNKNTGTVVANHFNTPDHSLRNLKYIILEMVHNQHRNSRLKRKQFWISKLKTLPPLGLNSLDN